MNPNPERDNATNPAPTQQETLERCANCGLEIALFGNTCWYHVEAAKATPSDCRQCDLFAKPARRAAVAGPRSVVDALRQRAAEIRASGCDSGSDKDQHFIDGGISALEVLADDVEDGSFTWIPAATASPAPAERPPSIADAIAKVREMEAENKRNYEYWKSIASEPTDMGVMKFLCWAGEDSRVVAMLESLAPAERTRVEGEQKCVKCGHTARRWHGFCQFRATDDVVNDHVCGCQCEFNATSDSARRAAEEIHKLCDEVAPDIPNDSTSYAPSVEQITAIISKHFAAAPADNDALEVCRLLSTLDWIVGYELVGENQTILDRAQELALKVMGMSDSPTTKGDR